MVQALLKYENPRIIVRSILNMEIDDVMWLSCDVAGSHVIDAFLTSPTVASVKKKRIINNIMVCVCTCISHVYFTIFILLTAATHCFTL